MTGEIILGEVVRIHGVKGAVRIRSYAESSDIFLSVKKLWLRHSSSGKGKRYYVEYSGGTAGKVILKFSGVDTREDATNLVGSLVTTMREELPDTDDGEYYWYDLIGMGVYDISGRYYGIIKHILSTGSNDVYVVEGDGGNEILIPATFDAVKEIDVHEKRMVIEPTFGSFSNADN